MNAKESTGYIRVGVFPMDDLTVDNSIYHNDLGTAIENSYSGQTIIVMPGVYDFSTLTISKPVNIYFERGVTIKNCAITITSIDVNFLGYPDLYECTMLLNNDSGDLDKKIKLEIGTISARSRDIVWRENVTIPAGSGIHTLNGLVSRHELTEGDIFEAIDIYRVRNLDGLTADQLKISTLNGTSNLEIPSIVGTTKTEINKYPFIEIRGSHTYDIVIKEISGYETVAYIYGGTVYSKLSIISGKGKIRLDTNSDSITDMSFLLYNTKLLAWTLANEAIVDMAGTKDLYAYFENVQLRNFSNVATARGVAYTPDGAATGALQFKNSHIVSLGTNTLYSSDGGTELTGMNTVLTTALNGFTDHSGGKIVVDAGLLIV